MITINLDGLAPSELAKMFYIDGLSLDQKRAIMAAGRRNCGDDFGGYLEEARGQK